MTPYLTVSLRFRARNEYGRRIGYAAPEFHLMHWNEAWGKMLHVKLTAHGMLSVPIQDGVVDVKAVYEELADAQCAAIISNAANSREDATREVAELRARKVDFDKVQRHIDKHLAERTDTLVKG